jgi:hypothetical protein
MATTATATATATAPETVTVTSSEDTATSSSSKPIMMNPAGRILLATFSGNGSVLCIQEPGNSGNNTYFLRRNPRTLLWEVNQQSNAADGRQPLSEAELDAINDKFPAPQDPSNEPPSSLPEYTEINLDFRKLTPLGEISWATESGDQRVTKYGYQVIGDISYYASATTINDETFLNVYQKINSDLVLIGLSVNGIGVAVDEQNGKRVPQENWPSPPVELALEHINTLKSSSSGSSTLPNTQQPPPPPQQPGENSSQQPSSQQPSSETERITVSKRFTLNGPTYKIEIERGNNGLFISIFDSTETLVAKIVEAPSTEPNSLVYFGSNGNEITAEQLASILNIPPDQVEGVMTQFIGDVKQQHLHESRAR